MDKLIINYALRGPQLSNPDGSLPVTVNNPAAVAAGPGATELGAFEQALVFNNGSTARGEVPVALLDTTQFCVRAIIKVDVAPTGRQTIVASTAIPFFVTLANIPGSSDEIEASVSVITEAHGLATVRTPSGTHLELGTWHLVDLVYDTDTLAIAVDGSVVAVTAFPMGAIATGAPALFIGQDPSGGLRFNGSIAALQVHAGIPAALEALLDEHRGTPEWQITRKYHEVKSRIELGSADGPIRFNARLNAHVQRYNHGTIMYAESVGTAFVIQGAIFAAYQAMPRPADLGFLVSDEVEASVQGSRKSVFSQGAIYWSSATGAVPVIDEIYREYAAMGDAAWIGLPMSAAKSVTGGHEQIFQRARMYHQVGQPAAFATQGAILARYLATGGLQKWGFPTSNEHDIRKGAAVVGRTSSFERCTFYWQGNVGAFEVHGSIHARYLENNGPIGPLGFPTSDETDIPGAPGARANTFQHGSLLWFGSEVFVCRALKIKVGRVDTRESEGATMGQNDLIIHVAVEESGKAPVNKRFPESGDFSGKNSVEINRDLPISFNPVSLNQSVKITFHVKENDTTSADEDLGTFVAILDATTAWGLKDRHGLHDTGSFKKVRSITWSVFEDVDIATLTELDKWWGPKVPNQGTSRLSYSQYGAAFRDVDPEPEDWDVTDWLDKVFYEAVIKKLANGGNCFGMSLEAIYARKKRGLLTMPIRRFDKWDDVKGEFNVRHQYQAGSASVWWFVSQFLFGRTHDPVAVFKETRAALRRGDDPVVNIAQNYDFSGAPHTVLAVGHDDTKKPWKLEIRDPNFVGDGKEPPNPELIRRFISIDPDTNKFSYAGADDNYHGGEFSGGRLHYHPFSVVGERPRTPIWDVIMLALTGMIFFCGDAAETVSLTDGAGVDLNVFGPDAVAKLKAGQSLTDKLVPFHGSHGTTPSAARFFLGALDPKAQGSAARARHAKDMSMLDLAAEGRLPIELLPVGKNASLRRAVLRRALKFIARDEAALARLPSAAADVVRKLCGPSATDAVVRHAVKGTANGQMDYIAKHLLGAFRYTAPIETGETVTMRMRELGTPSGVVSVKGSKARMARVEIASRLGVGADHLRVVIDRVQVDTGRDLNVHVRPGLSGVEIHGATAGSRPQVTVHANIDGHVTQSKFDLPNEGGWRMHPATVLSRGRLKVGRLDGLFGALREIATIKPA